MTPRQRHDAGTIALLVVGFLIICGATLAAVWREAEPVECPPYWQCNGWAETNNPRCDCWDKR